MAVNTDFRDLFAALSAARAEYLVIGGYAFSFHAFPRFTKDLDIWVRPSPGNAERVHRALSDFGAPVASLTTEDLANEDLVYQMGLPPNRIDVLSSIAGVTFAEAWRDRAETIYGDQKIYIIGRAHLLANKRAVGRPQDLVDAAQLEKLEKLGG